MTKVTVACWNVEAQRDRILNERDIQFLGAPIFHKETITLPG